jgi:hypothetical protein
MEKLGEDYFSQTSRGEVGLIKLTGIPQHRKERVVLKSGGSRVELSLVK